MNRAIKLRIYPDKEQEKQLAKTFGCCRFLYNSMQEVDALALANVQLHLERAYKNFFEKPAAGFPKYKAKHRSRQNYTTNVVNGNIRLEEGKLKLPKMSPVKVRQHRGIPEGYRLKSVAVSQEPSGKYYASLLYTCESQVRKQEGKAEKILGVDFAMDGLAVFSDGTRAEYPMYYKRREKRLAREQRRLSGFVRGSRNYAKQKKRAAVCHEKIKNQRKDYQHKLSKRLAESYDAVCV